MPIPIGRVQSLAAPVIAWRDRAREFLSQFDPPPDAYPSTRLRILRFFSLWGAVFSVPIGLVSLASLMTNVRAGVEVFSRPFDMVAGAIGIVTAIPVYLALRAHRRSGLIVYLIGCIASLGRAVLTGVQTGHWGSVVWQVGVLAFLLSLWTELDQ